MIFKSSAWMLALVVLGCASTSSTVTGPAPYAPTDKLSSAAAKPAAVSPVNIPSRIRQPPYHDTQLTEVQRNIPDHVGNPVRWGGAILSLQNVEGWTRIQVLGHSLDHMGRPQTGSPDLGVFVVEAKIPFDTATYAQGREITVAGTVSAAVQSQSQGKQAQVPLITAEDLYLWGKTQPHDLQAASPPSYGRDLDCHYVYQGRCYSYYAPRRFGYSPWRRYGHGNPYRYGPSRYGYGDPWYRYGYRHGWWPQTFFHFGFYGDW